jgi:hypothetical protein
VLDQEELAAPSGGGGHGLAQFDPHHLNLRRGEADRRLASAPEPLMLAYLFWHQPANETMRDSYESALVGFHRRLRDVPVPGLVAWGTARVSGLPWMPGDGYEDWYAVEDFHALGMLNSAAVDGAHADAHDLVAHASDFGAGGLYALERGDLTPPGRYCAWLAKPTGVSYADFRTQLASHTVGETVAIWRRQMVLGPAPEFRLTATRELTVPASMAPVACHLTSLSTA